MKDDKSMIDFKVFWGFALKYWRTNGQTDKRTDICDCRVAFATEKTIQLVQTKHFNSLFITNE